MSARRRSEAMGMGTLALASPLFAHTGALPDPGRPWWTHWNPDALIIANLFFFVACYVSGIRHMRAQRGADAPVRPLQVWAFGAGIGCLIVALLSPVDVLAGELLWVHMVQHMTLMNLAAPLVVLGAPARTILWAFPPSVRGRIGRWRQLSERRGIPRYMFWQPLFLWALYAFVLWVWHLPVLYEAALRHAWVHDVQHLIFFGASCLFWRVMFDPIGRLRLSQGGRCCICLRRRCTPQCWASLWRWRREYGMKRMRRGLRRGEWRRCRTSNWRAISCGCRRA